VRIVAARDGGLCRIRLPGGALSADAADAIAQAALAHASGVIEATNRANLQIRGVRPGEQRALIERLLAAGLGPAGTFGAAGIAANAQSAETAETAGIAPIARGAAATGIDASTGAVNPVHAQHPANPAADDVRNLMLSPTAGRDRAALIDTLPLAEAILALLRDEPRFAALSPKFALQLDGGEQLTMLGHPHDIWLAALPAADGPCFAFGLAGCAPVAPHDPPALAAVRPADVPALVRALLHAFVDLATPEMTRMRDLLAERPAEALLAHAAARGGFALLRDPQIAAWRRSPARAALRFGVQPQRSPGLSHVGAQPPLGRLAAASLRALATLAREAGSGMLRVTPWQSVLLPDVPERNAQAALAGLAALGFACAHTQPLARLIACAGSSGCAKGHADTKADAMRLAPDLPSQAEVHLSGCTRSCAAAHPVPFTLLATAPDRYDLYLRDAARSPQAEPGFGLCIAHNLTIDAAATLLQQRSARSFPDA
jgi:precorrin-3B synthase